MIKNSNLQKAKAKKNDEFYTQLSDIENELANYTAHFAGKVVYLPCDAEWSNFWGYFVREFHSLGLKHLVATSADNMRLDYDGMTITRTPLVFGGWFDNPESLAVLASADIVVTNPPFSLFRDFVGLLVRYGKQFLLVGNYNAVGYSDIFKLIKNSNLWLGCNMVKKFIDQEGKMHKFGNICWFTNLSHNKRNDKLELTACYDPAKYPRYDNYDAIECSKVADIPKDYYKVIGVPITFLDKFNPDQFELIGQTMSGDESESIKPFKLCEDKRHSPFIEGVEIYRRILIKHKHDRAYLDGRRLFPRILIKHKC